MKNSGLLKWASNNKKASKEDKSGDNGKKWLHSPDTLKNGHVAYIVKFLGSTEVDKPKGIEVVKQGVQKLKFNQQLKKSEGQNKTPKVELTISVEGVAIQEPKTKKVLHQYPLHKISYCADDRAEKRFFSFISKEGDSEKHTCFVFVSDKLAEEITLTIGQAFELAYKQFLDTNGKELESQKQMMTLQKRVALLENENSVLKARLTDVSKLKEVRDYMTSNHINDLCHVEQKSAPASENKGESADVTSSKSESNKDESEKKAENGGKDTLINLDENGDFDGLTLDDLNDLNDFNPRAGSSDDDEADFNPRAAAQTAPAATPTQLPFPPVPPRDVTKGVPMLPPRDSANNNEFNSDSFFKEPAVAPNTAPKPAADPTNPFANEAFPSGNTDPFGMSSFDTSGTPGAITQPFSKFPSGNSIVSGFTEGWGRPAGTTGPSGINAISFDDLDPLKK